MTQDSQHEQHARQDEPDEQGHSEERHKALTDPDYYAPLEREPDGWERPGEPPNEDEGAEDSEDEDGESLGDWQQRLAAEQVTFYYNELDKLASQARRGQHYWELGGVDGISPLDALAQALARQLDETKALAAHAHVWDTETGYCSVCGQDGRA